MRIKFFKKQRDVGKQLLLVNIIHSENDRALEGGCSFLSTDDLAKWASMTKYELDNFINVCAALDPYCMARDAAEECCKEEPFRSEGNAYFFVMVTFSRMGKRFAASLDIDKFEDYCRTVSEQNYKTFCEKYGEYPVPNTFSSPEILKKMMGFYIKYMLTIINKTISQGYDWAVITSMTRSRISEERYQSLVDFFEVDQN